MAQWTADKWTEYGWTSRLDEYCKLNGGVHSLTQPELTNTSVVYLNYPVSQSLQLTLPNGTVFHASLEEAVLEQDETTRCVAARAFLDERKIV